MEIIKPNKVVSRPISGFGRGFSFSISQNTSEMQPRKPIKKRQETPSKSQTSKFGHKEYKSLCQMLNDEFESAATKLDQVDNGSNYKAPEI